MAKRTNARTISNCNFTRNVVLDMNIVTALRCQAEANHRLADAMAKAIEQATLTPEPPLLTVTDEEEKIGVGA